MSQRSPVIFWLLFAATIGVYAVVVSWLANKPFPAPAHAWAAFDALTVSQLSLVCIWSALGQKKSIWTRLTPVVAVLIATSLVAAVIDVPVSYWSAFWAYLPGYGLHAALLLAVLWMIQRSTFWKNRFGTDWPWQISMAELLAIMTAVAVLTAAIRESPLFGDEALPTFLLVVASVGLAVASVALWSTLSLNWLERLGSTLIVAFVFGAPFGIVTDLPAAIFGADFLVQAVVLSVWLGAGPILPATRATSAADVPSTQR